MIDADERVSIRQTSADDIGLLSVLGATTFYEAYFEQDDPNDIAAYISQTFAPEQLAWDLAEAGSAFYLMMLDGRAIGYARMIEGSRHDSIVTRKTTELQRIYVVERVWGSGMGILLLDHCLAEAKERGSESVWLGVWENNIRGRRFYEKHSFVLRGALDFPYGKTIGTNLVMERMI